MTFMPMFTRDSNSARSYERERVVSDLGSADVPIRNSAETVERARALETDAGGTPALPGCALARRLHSALKKLHFSMEGRLPCRPVRRQTQSPRASTGRSRSLHCFFRADQNMFCGGAPKEPLRCSPPRERRDPCAPAQGYTGVSPADPIFPVRSKTSFAIGAALFRLRRTCLVILAAVSCGCLRADVIRIAIPEGASPRIEFGATKLVAAVSATGSEGLLVHQAAGARVVIAKRNASMPEAAGLKPEGFLIETKTDGVLSIIGADDSGVLYGCLELAERVKAEGRLPASLHFADAPVMKLRGPCIGMQKPYILPGRHVYEYPYTPELFPFFYDREQWREYLDFLVKNRMNTLYLWNGHPFASLVKLPDYPEALEVSEEVFARNVKMFHFIAEEADKRGIWLVQMFYNIILSKPFAEHHGMKTQLSAPNPLAADYTRKSIAEFVRQYPNVGLMVCLGEALQDIPGQVQWCTQVILPGVKDGMKAAGLTEEPPVVIRAHATDPKVVMPAALKVYKNLYTEAKFNGESLTTWEPRGVWQETHRMLAALGSTHVVNVHILANLEPFRYGAVRFIKKCVQAARDRLDARGLHIYPLSYWNWPDAPDATATPLKQIDRDWIWFEAWARYAWNPDIDETIDHAYWVGRLAEHYGTTEAAEHVLAAYNASGECAPRLLRRFGITEGNRQTLSLGMTLDQLVNPEKYGPYPELWKSQSPPGERLQEYADREWRGEAHEGETPPQIIREVLAFSAAAVAAIDAAAPQVTRDQAEFERLRNDVRCIRAMSENYGAKANAALAVLRYAHSHDVADLERAERYLKESLHHYRTLVGLTEGTYRFANSMQTSQRRIPLPGGVNGKPANYRWSQLLGVYEQELAALHERVIAAQADYRGGAPAAKLTLRAADFRLLTAGAETYTVQTGSRVFTDLPVEIQSLAPELAGLKGIRFSKAAAAAWNLSRIEFETSQPVDLLIGYVQARSPEWLRTPELETDARAAERGATEPLLVAAATVDTLPAITVYAYRYGVGRHVFEPGARGAYLILGVTAAE